MVDRAWAKTAMDLFDFNYNKYLIIVDYYSRYFEYFNLGRDSTSGSVIKSLKDIFSRLGIVDTYVSDNGPPFFSKRLKDFAKSYGFELRNSAPLMANSNGLVEKSVAIAKNILRKSEDPYLALMQYRNSPVKNVNQSPNELMFGRLMKTNLPVSTDLLKNHDNLNTNTKGLLAKGFRKAKQQQEKYYNRNAHILPKLSTGDSVRYKKLANARNWENAELIKRLDNRNYLIKNAHGNE